MTWISILCPKHTFLLVVVQLQTCGHQKSLSIFENIFHPLVLVTGVSLDETIAW